MEEATMENIQDSIRYFCRVCTTNTRNTKSKPDEGIGIFKKYGLKSILEKHLLLKITETDPLPKVICKTCFEKIEAIEFLGVIARRTEVLLRDFLKNKPSQPQTNPHSQFQNEYPNCTVSHSSSQPIPQHDEVVVNVSLSDPLTKDMSKKLQVAQRKKDCQKNVIQRKKIVTNHPLRRTPVPILPKPKRKQSHMHNIEVRKKKFASMNTMSMDNQHKVLQQRLPVVVPPPIKVVERSKLMPEQPPPLSHISQVPVMPQKVEIHPVITENTQSLGHGVPLGSIIKDEDLLRLILKALKWPYNSQTLNIQMQRLKDTNFNDVIVDPNLLKDADLIQILGPMINPKVAPMQMSPHQPPYRINIPPEPLTIPSATISYKLPAETSVQIITVGSEEKSSAPKQSLKPIIQKHPPPLIRKKLRKSPKFLPKKSPVIVLSDESNDEPPKTEPPSEDTPPFEMRLDPALYPESSNSNEAMLATLNRQREAMMRMHRIKRKQNLIASNVEMVDDIMIVDEGVHMNETYPEVVLVKKPKLSELITQKTTATTTLASLTPVSVPSTNSMLWSKNVNTVIPHSTPLRKSMAAPNPQPPRKLPIKKEIPGLRKLPLLMNSHSTTVADADSTTKATIKLTKPPEIRKPSSDIEDQIVKMRIEKQVENIGSERHGSQDQKTPSQVGRDVVIYVDYEGDNKHTVSKRDTDTSRDPPQGNTNGSTQKKKESIQVVETPVKLTDQEGIRSESENDSLECVKAASENEVPIIEIQVEDSLDVDKTSEKELVIDVGEEPRDDGGEKCSSNDDLSKKTRIKQRRKMSTKEAPKPATPTFRPARLSKTLSKYYKGPPPPEQPTRLTRSRF